MDDSDKREEPIWWETQHDTDTDHSKKTTTGAKESIEDSSSSSAIKDTRPIEITAPDAMNSMAFLVDGKHIVSAGHEGKLRCWQVKNGKETGTPLDAGSPVHSIAVSRDGRWVAGGTESGQVVVWNARTREKENLFEAHANTVLVTDISQDSTQIATGSFDHTAYVWSLLTGERLLGPFEHNEWVVAVKFSPDDRLIATATYLQGSLRVYDALDGCLIIDYPIEVGMESNQSIAWFCDSKKIFASSRDGVVHCINVSSGTTLSKWHIHDRLVPRCISLASDGTFLATSAFLSISFWDAETHQQIGPVIEQHYRINCMAISADYEIMTGGYNKMTLRNLCDLFPSPYRDHMLRKREENEAFFKAANVPRSKCTGMACELGQDWRLECPWAGFSSQ